MDITTQYLFYYKLIKFLLMTLEGSECSDDLLVILKDKASQMYNRGTLSASDYKDICEYLEYRIKEVRK